MSTERFFDTMAPTYDHDVVEIGWDAIGLVRDWGFAVPPGARVLDAGCGTGAVLAWLAGADRDLAGFDVSEQMLRLARRRGELRGADLRQATAAGEWPWEDEAFDRVLCLAMLEFVEDLPEALDELARVLAPGGRALLSVEDVFDAEGIARPPVEERYGALTLWRRDRETLEASLPPTLTVRRIESLPGYLVDEHGFVCSYWVAEVERPWA